MKLTTRTQKAMLVARKYPQPKEQQQKRIPTLSEWEYAQSKNKIWKTQEIIYKPSKKQQVMGTKFILTPEMSEQIAIAVISHLNAMQQEPVKRSSKSVKKATPATKKQSAKEDKTYTGKEPCTFRQFRACYYKQKEEAKKPLSWQEFTDKYGDGKLTFEKASKMLSK